MKYAIAYMKFVRSVLNSLNKMGNSYINIKDETLGNYFTKADKDYQTFSPYSEAFLDENRLKITLRYDQFDDDYTRHLQRESGYSDRIVNKYLKNTGIKVETEYDDGEMHDSLVKITYTRKKKLKPNSKPKAKEMPKERSEQFKKLNINSNIKVKLNDKGIEILKNEYNALKKAYPTMFEKPFKPPVVDEEGYTTMQFWKLFHYFGNQIYVGNDNLPFDNDIKISSKNLEDIKSKSKTK